jgi:hypothetical protein
LLQLFLIPRNIPSENIDQKKEKNKQNSHNDASPKKYITFTRNISQGKKTTSMKNYSKQILKKIKLNTIQAIVLTLSRESTRQIVAVVHIDSARASSAAANFALTFYEVHIE